MREDESSSSIGEKDSTIPQFEEGAKSVAGIDITRQMHSCLMRVLRYYRVSFVLAPISQDSTHISTILVA